MGKKTVTTALCLAATVMFLFFATNASAGGGNVAVTLSVSTKGLDLSQPADARKLYGHIRQAAWVACTRGDRVDLEPAPNPEACQEKALADAIRSVKVPLLTKIYLQVHTQREATAHGIRVPQVASK